MTIGEYFSGSAFVVTLLIVAGYALVACMLILEGIATPSVRPTCNREGYTAGLWPSGDKIPIPVCPHSRNPIG